MVRIGHGHRLKGDSSHLRCHNVIVISFLSRKTVQLSPKEGRQLLLSSYLRILLLFSHSIMSDSLVPGGLQHTSPLCPSLSPGVCSNSCPLSRWCHPTISISFVPFSSCLQSFPSIKVFSNELALFMKWSNYWSFSFSIYPSNEYFQGWFPLGLVWPPCCPRDSQESSPAPQFKSINSSALSCLYGSTLFLLTSNSHILGIETDTFIRPVNCFVGRQII